MSKPRAVAVVDDDVSVRRAVGRLLKSAGFEALTFRSAGEFLEDRRQSEVACLILDLMMPGMDGLALQARIVHSGSTLPIVFITATDDPVREAEARAGGALAFVHKPFDDTMLLEAVRRALDVSGDAE